MSAEFRGREPERAP